MIKNTMLSTMFARKLLWFILLVACLAGGTRADDFLNEQDVCIPSLRPSIDTTKTEYRVGVLAIRGADAAYNEFNKTFSNYLTATAGQRFDTPLAFTMVPLNFLSLFSDVELAVETSGDQGVDFIYVNPSAFSCIESEYGSNTLVSQISRRVVGGQEYELTKFGGVIFSRSDNDAVNTIQDIRDKVVACASISGLGSGQMQFRLMQQEGLAYIQDPKQLVFTSNQGKVVNGVLQGKFDVGLVRTDQIERTTDASTGELVDQSKLKIINGDFEMLDGEPFPFLSSTILYPEWNVASLSHVPDNVAIEVQNAMLAIAEHAAVGKDIDACIKASNCTVSDNIFEPENICTNLCASQVDPALLTRCDSTADLSLLALAAKTNGKYVGWRSTLSYMELRNMQEETNFIRKDEETGVSACIRSAQIVDAVVCPPGHFRKPDEQVLSGCADAGLDCGDFQCLCKPCVKAFDVDVSPIADINKVVGLDGEACPKFAICGQVEQSKLLTFRAVDNKERAEPSISVRVLEGVLELNLPVERVGNYTYEFTFDASRSPTGIAIFEVYADGEQIPESPFRFAISERQCDEETGDSLMEVDDTGNCVCQSGSHKIGGSCVSNAILIPSIVVPLLALLMLTVYLYVEHKRKQADSVWAVKPDELVFDDPPAILGRGTFGLVLLAEYRGTQVAVKRVIPPKIEKKFGDASRSNWRNSLLGDGDVGDFDGITEQRQDIEFDFNASDLNKGTEEFDAMESGVLQNLMSSSSLVEPSDGTIMSCPSSKRPKRRASLTGNQVKTNSLFDFSNLNNYESKFTKSASNVDIGLESGGMQKVFEQLKEENSRPPTTCRRHSISAIGGSQLAATGKSLVFDVDLSDHQDDVKSPPVRRRGSNGSIKRRGSNGSSKLRGSGGSLSQPDTQQPLSREDGSASKYRPTWRPTAPSAAPRSSSMGLFGRRRSNSDPALADEADKSVYSDASSSSIDDQEFRKMIGEEATKKAKAVAVMGMKSGSYGQKSGWSSDYLHLHASGSMENSSGGCFSLKRVKAAFFGKGDEFVRLKREFVSEMRHLSRLRHPCITTVMGAVISKKSEPMLVMEYMDHGSLYDLIHNESMIVDGELVLPILRDIAQGVRFLHAATPVVIHGDLKAQNVLVDSKFRAKVADFGLSQKRKIGATGTPLWMAPELLRGESENTAMSDVYSMGIILYEVYSRKDPYEGENHLTVLREVADRNINKRPPVPKICPPKIAGIMTDCLVGDPESRPTFEELDLRLKRLDVENVQPGQTIFSMQKKKEERAARSEELLFDVFPRHVAEALRDGRKMEAESFDCVSIFFSDIVGYTTISSKLHPRKVSDMLDRLYTKFDNLSVEYDIFKIETIGDAVSFLLLLYAPLVQKCIILLTRYIYVNSTWL
jgi:serine/threonine protein kinase/ABC-type phosphate/phosphonate transport system substrate-binding protein